MIIEETYLHFMFSFTVNKELPSLYLVKLNNLNPAGISKKAMAYQGLEHDQENAKKGSVRKRLLTFEKNMGG